MLNRTAVGSRPHIRRTRGITPWVAVFFLILLSSRDISAEEKASGLAVGTKAPNFNLNMIAPKDDGKSTVRLYDLVGSQGQGKTQLIVLSFFAMWCKPCKAEMPILERVHQGHKETEVRVLTILVEGTDDRPQKEIVKEVRDFAEKNKVTFPILYDPFMKDVVASRYLGSQMELPGVYFIGPRGDILRVFHEKRDDLPALVGETLKELSGK